MASLRRKALPGFQIWRACSSVSRKKSFGVKREQGMAVLEGEVVRGALLRDMFSLNVRESQGKVHVLNIYNLVDSYSTPAEVQEMYPVGARVWIRGTSPSSSSALVKNPSLVTVVSYFSAKVMTVLQTMDAEQLRNQGSTEFDKGNYHGAAEIYGMVIDRSLSKEEMLLAYSNRAECYLSLGMWKEAGEDCRYALELDHQHVKTLFRLAKALHGMQEYSLASVNLRLAAALSPGDKAIEEAVEKTVVLQEQSRTGQYGPYLKKYFLNGSKWEEAEECSEYLGPAEVRLTQDGRGRGLYATKGISAGELVMVCKPLAIARAKTRDSDPQEDVVVKLVKLCMKSKDALRELYALVSSCSERRTDVPAMHTFGPERSLRGGMMNQETEEEEEIDVERIRGIVKTSSFTMSVNRPGDPERNVYASMLLLGAFVNNSCLPNMAKVEVGNVSFFHASRDIRAGDELTVAYVDITRPWPTFRKDSFSFRCTCMRCLLEMTYDHKLKHVAEVYETMEANKSREGMKTLAALAPEIEKVMEKASDEEKMCIRTSYIRAYLKYYELKNAGEAVPSGTIPSLELLTQSLRFGAPGMLITIALIGELNGTARSSDFWSLIGYDAGEPHVLIELASQLYTGTGLFWFGSEA